MNRRRTACPSRWVVALAALALLPACEQIDQAHRDLLGPDSPLKEPPQVRTPRPAHWAQPVDRLDTDWVFRVDENLYRGPHPTPAMLEALPEVRTLINLRTAHDSDEPALTTGKTYVREPIKFWDVEDEPIVEFLRYATDERYTPVYIHCNLGSDRTGVATAMYRMVVHGWDRQEAIDEMIENGHGFNAIWENIVEYLNNVDVEEIRRKLKAAPPLPAPDQSSSSSASS